MMPHRCSNCEETGAKRSETARCKKKKKRNRFVSLASRSLLSLSSSLPVFLPGGCLSQSLSHLQGARLRSSLSWRGSLRRDRAAAAAAEGGAGGRGSLIVVVRERIERLPPLRFFFFRFREKWREVEARRSFPLFFHLSPFSPFSPFFFPNSPRLSLTAASHDLRRHAHACLRGHLDDGSVRRLQIERAREREERELAAKKEKKKKQLDPFFINSSCLLFSSSLQSSNRASRSRCVAVRAVSAPQVRWWYRMRRRTGRLTSEVC